MKSFKDDDMEGGGEKGRSHLNDDDEFIRRHGIGLVNAFRRHSEERK